MKTTIKIVVMMIVIVLVALAVNFFYQCKLIRCIGEESVLNSPVTQVETASTVNSIEIRELVIARWGDCSDDTCEELTINVSSDNKVEAVYSGMRDDSVRTVKKIISVVYSNGSWTLTNTGVIEYICQNERGQQEFDAKLCL